MTRNGRHLRTAAGLLALVVAAIHLHWGIPRFVAYASVATLADPRPLAFVLSGHAIALAITLVALGVVDARRTYLPGIALMLVHLVGYAAWHTVLAHGGVAPAAGGHTHHHGGRSFVFAVASSLAVVAEHLVNAPTALVSKLAELSVALLLGVLYAGIADE